MQKNETVFYEIGGMVFAVSVPTFPERETLRVFRTEKRQPDIRYTAVPMDASAYERRPDGSPFRVRMPDGTRLVYHEHTDELLMRIIPDGSGAYRVVWHEGYPECFGSNQILKLLDLPYTMLQRGGFFLHASCIGVEGEAILFTAPSQTGKSTQAAIWEAYRGAEIINGDRALVQKRNGIWYACGSPYCGTSNISRNRTLKLRAVVILKQAAVNHAVRASAREAFSALLNGSTYEPEDRDQIARITQLAGDLISSVPFYSLACTPDERAAAELEKIL